MKKLVVIPTYNERDNIIELMKVSLLVVPDIHILVVDDGSPDGTAQLVEDFMVKESRVFILKRREKKGLGQAYVAGFRWGIQNGYDFLSEMDADWSHPPKYLVPLYSAGQKYDFVIGSRYVRGGGAVNWTLMRRFISRFGGIYSRLILGVPITDFTGGFNGWHVKVLNAIDLDTIASDGYSFQIELKYRAAKLCFSFTEIPLIFEERREGQSKMSAQIVREAIWRVWALRFKNADQKPKELESELPSKE